MNDLFFFDEAQLVALGKQHHEAYVNNHPFPHICLDNFLPEPALEPVLAEFPDFDDKQWIEFKNANEKKQANNQTMHMPPAIRHLLTQFNSGEVCHFLEALTGIEGIIPDPYFFGGGQHRIRTGGYLKVHADFNHNAKLNLQRRLNLLLYLNKDWDESYGGHLQLWDKTMSKCEKKILPLFNRVVIFSTTSDSYHGHPDPLTCPEDRTRKSLALYYYTVDRPEEEKRDTHSTLFKQRPGETIAKEAQPGGFKELARQVTPPFIWNALRRNK